MLDKDTSSDSCGVGQTSALAGKEDKEKERRRKRYKYALVQWMRWNDKEYEYSVNRKEDLIWQSSYSGMYKVICDWEPERVLRGMLKLLKENEDG